MFTKCFDSWLDQREYAWSKKFSSKDEISSFILGHVRRGTSIGKIINKLKLDFSEECLMFQPEFHSSRKMMIVQEGVLAFHADRYIPNVRFTSDPQIIAAAYKDIFSCMTDGAEEMGQFLSDELLVEQGIRLATYNYKKDIVGRCVVNVKEKSCNEVYSQICGEEFSMALTELGFAGDQLTISHLKLPHGWIPYMDEIGSDGFVKCRIASNEEWCFIVPEDNAYYEEALRRVQRIVPDFTGDIEWEDADGNWVLA